MAEMMSATNPFLNFPYAPIRMECEARDLLVEGEVPRELSGTLYRNGPNQRFKPRGDYHLFAGDGMVHAFHIADGRIDYTNRWVRTAKWRAEDREGRNLVNPMNPFDCDPAFSDFVFTDKDGTANTAVLWHGDRLLAIEEGHPPFEIDPHNLDSLGSFNYRGKLHTAMTAHPKVDPVTGELVFFAYMATGPFAADVMVHKVSPEGQLTQSILVPTPYSAMVHDFVITENYIVIPIMPITGSMERAMSGGPPFAWEADKGAHVALLPRGSDSADDVRWLEMDPWFVFHFMNAFEQDGHIYVDGCQYPHAPLFSTPDGESTGQSLPFLCRWDIDLGDRDARVQSTQLDHQFESEFPQCDPRYVGRPYRHGWYTSPDGTVRSDIVENEKVYNTIGHYDHASGDNQRFSCGNAHVSEAIFVPRSADAAEGEGFLLAVVTSFDTRTSSLYIFDALSVATGPLAKAHLQHHVPVGFHGTWRQGAA
jgi:carotenoid cleavage dioxygenase